MGSTSKWRGRRRAGHHRGGLSPRPGLGSRGDAPAVRGTQRERPLGHESDGRASGRGHSLGQGQRRGRSARGAPGTAKLSPPPEVRGAEAAAARGSRCGVFRRPPAPRAAGEGAPEGRGGRSAPSPPPLRSPARARAAAGTHLAVELADRHDPAGRAEPGAPCLAGGPRSCTGGWRGPAPRWPGGSQSTVGPPGAIFLCRPGVSLVLVLFPRPAPPASWRGRGRLALGRRDLYSRRGGAAAARPERRAGGEGGGAAPLPAQVWEEVREPASEGGAGGRGAVAAACEPCRGRAGRALPRPRRRGVLGAGGGAGQGAGPAAPCWTPSARGDRCAPGARTCRAALCLRRAAPLGSRAGM